MTQINDCLVNINREGTSYETFYLDYAAITRTTEKKKSREQVMGQLSAIFLGSSKTESPLLDRCLFRE